MSHESRSKGWSDRPGWVAGTLQDYDVVRLAQLGSDCDISKLVRCAVSHLEVILMRAYVATTGVVFGLLTLAHIWRVIAEGPNVANPGFLLITLAAAALSIWAWRVLAPPVRPNP